MFNRPFLSKTKDGRTTKVGSQRYITNQGEPLDNPSHDSLAKDEKALMEDSPFMRIKFRGIAKRIRIIRIHGLRRK